LFPPEAEINLYRVVQEALANIIKHARAAVVEVRVKTDRGQLALCVADDGCGFDVASLVHQRPNTGLGLLGLSERTRILGGQIQVHSQPGQGTRLEITVPLPMDKVAADVSRR